MPPSSSARLRASRASELPAGFVSISDILDETIPAGSIANVAGLVKDCRLPIPTRGTDYKTALILYDISIQHESDGLQFNIFGPEDEMPQVQAGDVLLVYQAKVQRYRGNPLSLISSFRTVVRVFSASKILRPPRSAKAALLPPRKKSGPGREPNDKECEHVSRLYHEIDKYDLPDEAQFEVMAKASLNVKQKFCLLQDVCEGRFCDLVVQIVRAPYDAGDKVTLYVSDYTENDCFFNYTWEGVKDLSYADPDAWGYNNSVQSSTKAAEWIGPYGKKAMQITCFEPHASHIRSDTKAGSWVLLQNVQVKYGHNGANLEGFMRGERNDARTKICVHVLDTTNRDIMDSRHKDAIRRWREYTKAKKEDLKRLETTEVGLKRKLNEPDKKHLNSRQRRKLRRVEAEKKVDEKVTKEEQSLGLNQLISSESVEKPISSVDSIVEPVLHEVLIGGEPKRMPLPFICNKYRANVRVVDFRPNHLEDFGCSRRVTDFDCLSDNSGDESSDSADEDDDLGMGLIWEWRFMLQLEDASAKDKARNRVWAVVDNAEAQYLTGLDASNLRRDSETLATLRERLFTLWGDLEEHKARAAAEQAAMRQRGPGDMPPMDSSDGEDGGARPGANGRANEPAVSNKPFTCCVKQYGVRVREDDPALANAGNGWRWERVFGLFGTKICA